MWLSARSSRERRRYSESVTFRFNCTGLCKRRGHCIKAASASATHKDVPLAILIVARKRKRTILVPSTASQLTLRGVQPVCLARKRQINSALEWGQFLEFMACAWLTGARYCNFHLKKRDAMSEIYFSLLRVPLCNNFRKILSFWQWRPPRATKESPGGEQNFIWGHESSGSRSRWPKFDSNTLICLAALRAEVSSMRSICSAFREETLHEHFLYPQVECNFSPGQSPFPPKLSQRTSSRG